MKSDTARNLVVDAYSAHAQEYDQYQNLSSCWGLAAARATATLNPRPDARLVVEVGCGTGHALREMVLKNPSHVGFIGIEPADNMLLRSRAHLQDFPNVRLLKGRFEELPLESHSVDYLFSILAFHWTTDLRGSVKELARVLKPDGAMDLFFTGRDTGFEFTKKTTPIFLKYMGLSRLLVSAGMRKHLTRQEASVLFESEFPPPRLSCEESHQTYYDDLEGHWSWWVTRAAGHFQEIPPEKRQQCDEDIRQAISSLAVAQGIPYTIHLLHVKMRA